ncbi:UDP-2,3-diacylglucosamine diphosphatase [Winogradskyella sp.]|uniref:UDP-2,3-diacylglucosamine diphosphatase n=1 Tax=Winogradskyella sp. TaxID=1883156 RepID=UPI00260CCC55|nr:UDP-2,3-diacylglucosamine diphosphatase [Winogradskyella sp.]
MEIPSGKKIYFASDNHLGAPNMEASRPREKKFVSWLDEVKQDAAAIFLIGDLFDFWFEYKTVVPKGFTRTLGKLAEISDSGIPIYYFVGNHDLWMNGYFEEELGIPVYHQPQEFTFSMEAETLEAFSVTSGTSMTSTSFFVGHGDGLGPGDKGYKRMKKVFTNPVFKWLFRWLHPDIGVKIAQYLSVKNKLISGDDDAKFLGEENEWLALYSKRKLKEKHRDFFVFGHRHLPLEIKLSETSKYVNLGDWISYYTYGVFDGDNFELKKY